MNVSPRPLSCAEWMVRLIPVHVQQTQPEFLLITAVAAGQSESEVVSIYATLLCRIRKKTILDSFDLESFKHLP